jgi:sn-glycerol 3-phosphate transport system ATP-binding protein
VLGLRPEDVTVEISGHGSHFHVPVTAVEYLGGEALVTCMIGERPIVARTRGDTVPPIGAKVGLGWERSAAHLFDTASGQRLSIEPAAATLSPQLHAIANRGTT